MALIIYKTKHKQTGKRHDYKIYKDNHPKLPNEVTSIYDLGFLGVENDYPETEIISTHQKRKRAVNLLYSKTGTTAIILQRG